MRLAVSIYLCTRSRLPIEEGIGFYLDIELHVDARLETRPSYVTHNSDMETHAKVTLLCRRVRQDLRLSEVVGSGQLVKAHVWTMAIIV